MTDLKVSRGRAKTWEFTVTEDGAVPAGLAGAGVRFSIRQRFEPLPLVVKTLGSGVEWTDMAAGAGTFSLDGDELDGLPDWDTALVWDLVLVGADSRESAIDDGYLFVRTTASS